MGLYIHHGEVWVMSFPAEREKSVFSYITSTTKSSNGEMKSGFVNPLL